MKKNKKSKNKKNNKKNKKEQKKTETTQVTLFQTKSNLKACFAPDATSADEHARI